MNFPGENVSKAVEILLDKVMLRMENCMTELPGRRLLLPSMLQSNTNGNSNGNDELNSRIRIERVPDKAKCNC